MKLLLSKTQESGKLFTLTILFLFVTISSHGAEPKWYSKYKQIQILKTTKQEFEKLFNYPQITYTSQSHTSLWVEYKIKEGKITAFYSLGKCSEVNESKYGYDVNKDVLTSIDIDLQKPVDISKLGLNLQGFDKFEISDLPGVFEYSNPTIGERYITGEYFKNSSKKLTHIYWFPSESNEKLACRESYKMN